MKEIFLRLNPVKEVNLHHIIQAGSMKSTEQPSLLKRVAERVMQRLTINIKPQNGQTPKVPG